jgi:signal transduction histidine kinase
MRSLRLRLIVSTCIAVTVTLAVAGVLLFLLIRRGVIAQFDRSMADKAGVIMAAVEQEGGRPNPDFEDLDMAEFADAARGGFLQIRWVKNATLYRSPSLGEGDLPEPIVDTHRPFRWITLPTGRKARLLCLSFLPVVDTEAGRSVGSIPLKLSMARDAAPIDASLRPVIFALVGVGALTVAVMSLMLGLVARNALKPVTHVADQINGIRPSDLSHPVVAPDLPAELRPIVDRFNELLGRLAEAFARERRFNADVAHELRTPLSALRTTMEVALSRPRGAEEYREAFSETMAVVRDMQAMTETLLALAKAEAGLTQPRDETVDIKPLIETEWLAFERLSAEKWLNVEWRLVEDLMVRGDPSLLAIVFRNVLNNAVTYAPPNGDLRVEADCAGGLCTLRVANTASVTRDQAAHVFERFWRADASRGEVGSHFGLGLTLASEIVAMMGGRVAAEATAGGLFVLTLSLPKAGASSAAC